MDQMKTYEEIMEMIEYGLLIEYDDDGPDWYQIPLCNDERELS